MADDTRTRIASTADLKHLSEQLASEDVSTHSTHLTIHLHPTDLPLAADLEEGEENQHLLVQILSKFASSCTFTYLSLSCPLDPRSRFTWNKVGLSDGLVAALSLNPWAQSSHRLPALHVTGLHQVPAQAMYAWMSTSSSLTLDCVSLDFSTFTSFQPSAPSETPISPETLQHCSIKLRPLELANFHHFHHAVLGRQSPLVSVKSLELWTGGSLKNEDAVVQFLGHKRASSSSSSTSSSSSSSPLESLQHLAFYRIYDRTIQGEDPTESRVTLMALSPDRASPTIHSLSLGVKVTDLSDIAYHRKTLRAILKSTSTMLHSARTHLTHLTKVNYVFVDGYNIGSESLKYHLTQFIEMWRDAFQRPGHRVESYNLHYPVLATVRIVLRREEMEAIGAEEMEKFKEVAKEIGTIGEGTPKFSVVLEDDGESTD